MEKNKKILVAEDEKPIARALQLKLTKEGFGVAVVGNGQEALAAIAKEKFALVILDLMMPVIDGFGVLEKLKEAGVKTKVIVASNLSQEEDIIKAKKLGAVDFFVKSNTPIAQLVEKIKKYL